MSKVKLFQFTHPPGRNGGLQLSPPCLKAETALRFYGIEFEEPPDDFGSLKKAPKGKLPYIEDTDGTYVCDSELIIKHLKKTRGDILDQNLTPEQHAIGRALQRMFDEHFYWITVYFRWEDDEGWQYYKEQIFYGASAVVSLLGGWLGRGPIKKTLHGQGTSRHTRDELIAFAIEDISTIIPLLGSKNFLFGDSPSSYDCAVFAALCSWSNWPLKNQIADFISENKTLADYVDRIKKTYFKDGGGAGALPASAAPAAATAAAAATPEENGGGGENQ